MNIYLSPHHDDVCYSIGDLAGRERGDLLNLFTRSRYVAAAMDLPPEGPERVELVSRLRREEDERFARAAGLERHDLGLREPRLVGHQPFDLSRIDIEVAALSSILTPYLLAMLPREGAPHAASLYCPMGIGGHRNHLSTLMAVRGAYDELRRRCRVFLYEDLHYASVSSAREEGLRRAGQVFAGLLLAPIVLPLNSQSVERKMGWVALYASQHVHAPRLADFTPASAAAPGAHEIVWQVSPPIGVQT